mgnify:CR=1 FL=1
MENIYIKDSKENSDWGVIEINHQKIEPGLLIIFMKIQMLLDNML